MFSAWRIPCPTSSPSVERSARRRHLDSNLTIGGPIKTGIIIGGRFPAAYRTLEGLYAEKMEGRLVTSHPRSRLPNYVVGADGMRCHGWLEYFYRGVELVPGFRRIFPAQWLKVALLDRLAAIQLQDCAVINGWSGMCLTSFQQAKRRHAVTVLQTGSAHAVVQQRLVDKERRGYGVSQPSTSEAVLRRQVAEYALADVVVVPSSFVRRTFVEEGIPDGRLEVVPEGVDCSHLRPLEKRDEVFRVLYIGHLSFRKGVVHLLEAARSLSGAGIEFVVRGVVEPEFAPLLARYDGLYRRAEHVPAGGFADFVSQASVVVVPSIEDGWCAVTVEAMACGVPVIVSANTGTADVVREGIDGFVVPASSPDAIADKIRWLQEHEPERKRMAAAARSRALEFTWDNYRKRMSQVLRAAQRRAALETLP